ncbi:MAG: hemerythrin family protein [Desulfobacula sp.]|nr:hemerythrin family protein [Desulfobacula sp.]
MKSIEKMEWESKYSVGIEEIDNHQKKMFELFNELIDKKELKLETKEYINMIARINEYSRLYFSIEEKLLKKNGYPDFGEHAIAHRQFTKSFISLRREIAEDVENLSYDVIDELRNWMINHILTFDSLYIPFLRINKYVQERTMNRKN